MSEKFTAVPNSQLPRWRVFLKQARAEGATKEAANSAYDYLRRCEHFVSDTYHVALDKTPEHGFGDAVELWHLSIKRNDREAFHDWRVMQQIKNAICGREAEAIELYPAESRLVDTANQYHLWAFMNDGDRLPFGFSDRVVFDAGVTSDLAPDAKQRPLSET